MGIATATPDGLMVPVLHGADGKLDLAELALESPRSSERRARVAYRPSSSPGATFTVNNFGSLGIWLGTPIIRPPEVANLGVGAIRDQVVPVDGMPAVRPTLALAVVGDHRVLDGDTLAGFVTAWWPCSRNRCCCFEDSADGRRRAGRGRRPARHRRRARRIRGRDPGRTAWAPGDAGRARRPGTD